MPTTLIEYSDVPYELRTTAREWFDGGNSAMYRFYRGDPVDPARLLKEAREALSVCTIDNWRTRLEEIVSFASAEDRKAKAASRLRAAAEACIEAGLDKWEVARAFEAGVAAASEMRRQAETGASVSTPAPV